MKRAPLFVLAGTVAGFVGVLSFHSRPGAPAAAGNGPARAGGSGRPSPGASRGPSAASASGPARSATGPTEQYGYGQLAVKVTVHGGHITAVSVPSIQTAEPYSQQLATQVIPMLRSEVLAGQTARINGVSGATYTSEAYAMSLQSALDKLHIK